MQIKCDKCSAVSESIMPETYLEGDIEFSSARSDPGVVALVVICYNIPLILDFCRNIRKIVVK